MDIAELHTSPAGMPVIGLTARCKQAFDARTVQTKYGEKTVRDLVLEDGTGEIRASWWDPPSDLSRGASVEISARQNGKGQLSGATVRQGTDKDGNPRTELAIRADHIAVVTAQPAPASSPARPAARPTSAAAPGPSGGLTLSAYLEAAGRAYLYARNELQVADEAAAVAFANTVGIAATNGKLDIDDEVPSES
jgi:hypothetical protein